MRYPTFVQHHISANKGAVVKANNATGVFFRRFTIELGCVQVYVHPDQARRLRDSIDEELKKPDPGPEVLQREDWLYNEGSEEENPECSV